MNSSLRRVLVASVILALATSSAFAAGEPALRQIVTEIAGPNTRGRAADTDLESARNALHKMLRDLGPVLVQDFEVDGVGTLQNLVLPREGSGDAQEWVVVVAHYDHLGVGGDDDPNPGKTYFGADDNASGVAVLLESARYFASEFEAPQRGVLFALTAGEEIGLKGARAMVADLEADGEKVVAVVNLDTVGRLADGGLTVFGVASARQFGPILSGLNSVYGLDLKPVDRPSGTADDQAFAEKGIPTLHLFTGAHATYHRPGDTTEALDFEGMGTLVEFTAELVDYLAQSDTEIDYVPAGATAAIADPQRATEGRRRVSFGSIPDFQFTGEGVKITGVIPGSPAAQAGLAADDVIVAFGEAPISDLTDYSEAMKLHQPGDEVLVAYLRGGERLTATVTLVERK